MANNRGKREIGKQKWGKVKFGENWLKMAKIGRERSCERFLGHLVVEKSNFRLGLARPSSAYFMNHDYSLRVVFISGFVRNSRTT